MRKIIFLLSVCLIQNIYGQISDSTWYQLDKKFEDDFIQANKIPIIRIIHDTLNLDSLKISYYQNGMIFRTEPYKYGCKNGVCETYFSNGQIESQMFFINNFIDYENSPLTIWYTQKQFLFGFRIFKRTYVTYDFNGGLSYEIYYGRYRLRNVRLEIQYVNNKPISLRMYRKNNFSKEFEWDKNKQRWIGKTHFFKKIRKGYFNISI